MLRKRLGARGAVALWWTVAMEMSVKVYPETHGKWNNISLKLKSGSNPILVIINYVT